MPKAVRSARQLYRFGSVLWIIGTVLIVLSWIRAASAAVGWAGFVVSLVGVAISWFATREKALPPELRPASPSGVAVDQHTNLEPGSSVLVHSNEHWWRARIIAIEDGEMVRVGLRYWDPSVQLRVPRSQLQMDPSREDNEHASSQHPANQA